MSISTMRTLMRRISTYITQPQLCYHWHLLNSSHESYRVTSCVCALFSSMNILHLIFLIISQQVYTRSVRMLYVRSSFHPEWNYWIHFKVRTVPLFTTSPHLFALPFPLLSSLYFCFPPPPLTIARTTTRPPLRWSPAAIRNSRIRQWYKSNDARLQSGRTWDRRVHRALEKSHCE